MENLVYSSSLLTQELEKAETVQLVTFEIANETFGIDILNVQEIIQLTKPTRVPKTPEYVLGVINLRGKIVPIVDLRKKLGLGLTEYDNSARIIVLLIQGMNIGIIVDKMYEILYVEKDKIEKNPTQVFSKIGENYISGVVNLEQKLLILLDLIKVFDLDKKQ
ncbi:MAG: chemotaxis protein CheW [Ignavibacteria bacterium]|nr:chemotaxis protein CheW [Ignavibacteria bacterium]